MLGYLPIARAINGEIQILNNLDTPIYLWSVSDFVGPMETLAANGGRYNEAWHISPNGRGTSIKMATQPVMSDVIQFEYTVHSTVVYWDVSLIDSKPNSPFIDPGFAVIPDRTDCNRVICRPQDYNCPDVYFEPNDNYAVRGCESNTKLRMVIGLMNR